MRRLGVIALRAVVFLVVLSAGPAWAGPNNWSGIGPEGGPIRAVLVTPSAIYVGTGGSGVFKSTDSGATWVQSDTLATGIVRAIVLGGAPGTLYAGVEDAPNAPSGGVFQSVDFGDTWTPMDTNLASKQVQALAWDGTSLYAGTKEETGFPGGVFKWDGATWTAINNGLPNNQSAHRVQALAVDPRPVPPVVYAGTQGEGVFKTIDGGANWARFDDTLLPNQDFKSDCLVSPEILTLMVDGTIPLQGTTGAVLYAGATGDVGDLTTQACSQTPAHGGHQGQGAGFFRFLPLGVLGCTADRPTQLGCWDRRMGGDFETLLPTTVSTNVWTVVMDVSVIPPATSPAIYVGTDIGVFRSTSQTGSWNRMPAAAPGGLINLPVRALGIDTTGQVTLYAGTSGRGVFKRLPPNNQNSVGIQQWTAANTGLTALRAQAVTVASGPQPQSTVLAGLVSGGIIKSVDGGATWQNTSDVSTTIGRTVLGIAVDPSDPSTAYAATAKGVIKSVDGGDSWALASNGLPTTTTLQDPNDPTPYRKVRSIIVDPANQDVLYAAVGGVRTSVDGGANWSALNGGLPSGVTSGAGTVSAFVIDHRPGTFPVWGNLYAATDGSGMFRSTDGGVLWTEVNTGIPGPPSLDRGITALALDPLPSGSITLYAGTLTGKVFRTDSGASWVELSSGLPGNPVTALAIELAEPRAIYAALSGGAGVYVSKNGGATWTPMNAGLPSVDVTGLVVDGTHSPHTVYAATLGRGTLDFQITLPNAPTVLINSPLPPYPHSASTSSIAVSGTVVDDTGVSSVLWSTNRGHAGLASGTTSWTAAAVPLEPGLNVITVTAVDTSSNEGSASITVTLTEAGTSTNNDFNGDGRADILWRHTSGTVAVWLMNPNGTSVMTTGVLAGAGPDWTVVDIGDFDGDHNADIVWRHTSGAVAIWLMSGTTVTSVGLPGSVTTDWTIVGVGDFNHDGKADILWRHTSGAVVVWFMNGIAVSSVGSIGSVTTDWTIVGVGDFDGDGQADILWRHSSGTLAIWLMNGAIVDTVGVLAGAGTGWTIVGVGDFDGDGNADILWRHTSGLVYEWLMNGTSVIDTGSPGAVGTDWTIDGVGDFNGDRNADILWRHDSGIVYTWLLNGTSVIGTGSPGGAGTDWEIQ